MDTPEAKGKKGDIGQLVALIRRLDFLEKAGAAAVLDRMWSLAPEHLRASYLLKTRQFADLATWNSLPESRRRALRDAAREVHSLALQGRPGAREAYAILRSSGALDLLGEST